MIDNKDFISTSHAGGGQASYLESLYESYLKDPSSIPEDWMHYFNSLPTSEASGEEASHQEVINRFKTKAKSIKPQAQKRNVEIGLGTDPKQIKVIQLIQAYRNRGHHKATLDPLSLKPSRHCEDLELSFHGLDQSDLENQFSTDSLRINKDTASLAEIISSLEKIYCGNLGIEYNYISSINERQWFQQRLEPNLGKIDFTDDEKVYIHKRLSSADGLAKFLASRYPGMKRFGIEGAESLIPLVDSLIQNCGIFGAQQICFGMAHRGRLNLLVNVLGKSPKELFAAFEEDFELEGASTGDVKYHLGFSSNILTPNGEVHVSLGNNPSHLEIVNPVVVGSVRARQDRLNDHDQNLVVPILIHGDAAFSGQGVVMETLQMSQTRGYGVGGSIHVIVNNQIGFTTSSEEDSRSGPYATDVAKIIEAPILHVNGDDPEMVVFAAKLACEYRNTFKKDIVLDMFCFRRKGHNEADEPSSTQPIMYQAIKNHPSVKDQYQERLIQEQILSLKDCDEMQKNYRTSIEKGDNVAHNLATKPNEKLWFDWTPYMNQTWKQETDTSFDENNFKDLAKNTFSVPQNFEPQKQVEKLLNDRLKMADGQMPINWGFAENMAYATLLTEGYPIRFTGQDVRRGTFSHRHAVLHNQKDGLGVMPLVDAANKANTTIDIYDSLLSVDYYVSYLACAQAGFYMVPINWHLAGPEIAYILEDSGAKAFIASGSVPAMEDACLKAVSAINFPTSGCISTTPIEGFISLDNFLADQPTSNPEDRTAGQVMNYTSGTTGKPKGVKRNLVEGDPDDILSMFAMILSFFDIQPGEDNVHIVGSPLYHTAVLVHSTAALHYGHSVVLMEKFDAEKMLYLIDKFRVTTSHMVPTQFHRLLQLPEEIRSKYDCSSTRAMIHAAAPCPVHTKKDMISWWGNSIWEYYAATEGGGTVVDAKSWSEFPGTVGQAWPGAEIKIINEDGSETPTDEQGTVFMKLGEATKFEYKGDQAKTKKERLVINDQVYFTVGDIGYLNKEGYLFLCDRKIDMIISGGANIYPAEIESVLLMHPQVADAAVFGIPNEEWGEEVKAVIELIAGVESSDQLSVELMAFAQENLAKMKLPRSIDFMKKLPRDENGKLYKRKLRDPYWENHVAKV